MDVNQKARLLSLLRDCTEHVERSDDFAPVLPQTLSALQEHTFLCQNRLMTSMQNQILSLQATKHRTASTVVLAARAPQRQRKVQTTPGAGDGELLDPTTPYGTRTIPITYRFPISLLNLWIHWCIPNDHDKIPPLKDLKKWNFKGTDDVANQRPVRKDYSDVKFICEFVASTALDAGFSLHEGCQWKEAKAREAFDLAYDTIFEVHPLHTREATMHANWKTFIKRLRPWMKARSMKKDVGEDGVVGN